MQICNPHFSPLWAKVCIRLSPGPGFQSKLRSQSFQPQMHPRFTSGASLHQRNSEKSLLTLVKKEADTALHTDGKVARDPPAELLFAPARGIPRSLPKTLPETQGYKRPARHQLKERMCW